MKRVTASLAAIILTSTVLYAQKGSSKSGFGYNEGDKLLNVGIGVNSYYAGGHPVGASFELGITDELSVGGNFDYLDNTNYGLQFTVLYFGTRISYHFNESFEIDNNKVDLYGGAALGYRSFKWNDAGLDRGSAYESRIYAGAFIGAKYYFLKNIGALAEVGALGSTNARVGIGFKF